MKFPARVRWWLLVPPAVAVVALVTTVPLCGGGTAVSPVRVSYTGGERLWGMATLRAGARASGARVAAVSFFLDGRPVGTDTVAPFSLDFPAALERPGSHRLKIVAVDDRGRRGSSGPIRVKTGGRLNRMLEASPARGLSKALRALAEGNVTVRLAPGRYVLDSVSLGSGARLLGSGPTTVIAAPEGRYWAVLVARGRRVRVSDLAIDGAGPADIQGDGGYGHAVEIASGAGDVRLTRLRMKRVREAGIYASGSYRNVSVQDSVISGAMGASAGVLYGDRASDASVIRTRVSGFKDWGVNFVHVPTGDAKAAPRALALDNRICGINDPNRADGTNEGAIWSGGTKAAIIGNVIRNTGWDGIETVGSSLGISVVDNEIARTPVGIYIEHSTNRSLFKGNTIQDVKTGINVEWRYQGVGSNQNRFVGNEIANAERGLFIDVGDDGNLAEGNLFANVAAPITLQGSSGNVIRSNRACSSGGRLVSEVVGLWEDQTLAVPRDNSIARNSVLSCSKLRELRRER